MTAELEDGEEIRKMMKYVTSAALRLTLIRVVRERENENESQ